MARNLACFMHRTECLRESPPRDGLKNNRTRFAPIPQLREILKNNRIRFAPIPQMRESSTRSNLRWTCTSLETSSSFLLFFPVFSLSAVQVRSVPRANTCVTCGPYPRPHALLSQGYFSKPACLKQLELT